WSRGWHASPTCSSRPATLPTRQRPRSRRSRPSSPTATSTSRWCASSSSTSTPSRPPTRACPPVTSSLPRSSASSANKAPDVGSAIHGEAHDQAPEARHDHARRRLSPYAMRGWYAAMGEASTSVVDIVAVGDSITEGGYYTGLVATGLAALVGQRPPHQ